MVVHGGICNFFCLTLFQQGKKFSFFFFFFKEKKERKRRKLELEVVEIDNSERKEMGLCLKEWVYATDRRRYFGVKTRVKGEE